MDLANEIKKLDKPGRDKTKRLIESLGYEFKEPTNEKLAYDCYFTYEGKLYLIEIKDRKPEYEKYDEFILEVDKYERLKKWKAKLNAAGIYYLNWFGNKCFIFNLEDDYITDNRTTQWMNARTAESRTNKIPKDVYLIQKAKAKIFSI